MTAAKINLVERIDWQIQQIDQWLAHEGSESTRALLEGNRRALTMAKGRIEHQDTLLTAQPQASECCVPTEEDLRLLNEGHYTPEELWGLGGKPSCPKCLRAQPQASAAQVPLSHQFVDAVKRLCKDFSDRQDRPYMGDVYAALDGLLEHEQIPVAAQSAGVPEGWRLVPVEPTEEMWSGLARDLIMWLDFGNPTVDALRKHLTMLGKEWPDWMDGESEMRGGGVPSKGTRATLIYKAMLAAAPAQGQQVEWRTTAVMLEQANAGLAQLNGKLRAELAALKAQQAEQQADGRDEDSL